MIHVDSNRSGCPAADDWHNVGGLFGATADASRPDEGAFHKDLMAVLNPGTAGRSPTRGLDFLRPGGLSLHEEAQTVLFNVPV
jgi:hypothetical protein